MSHSIEVFVAAELKLVDVAREFETLLHIPFAPVPHQGLPRQTAYVGHAPGILVSVAEHNLENEDLPEVRLSAYRYLVSISGTIDNGDERERRLYEYAYFVFDKLKEQNKYRIIMTDDLQELLDTFDPSAE